MLFLVNLLFQFPPRLAFGSVLELVSVNIGSVLLTVLLSVILIGVCIYILYRETRKPSPHMATPVAPPSPTILPRHQHLDDNHTPQHTLPRTLRSKHQDLMA